MNKKEMILAGIIIIVLSVAIGYFINGVVPTTINLTDIQENNIRADEQSKCNAETDALTRANITLGTQSAETCRAKLLEVEAQQDKLLASREIAWDMTNDCINNMNSLKKLIIDMNKSILDSNRNIMNDLNILIKKKC